MSLYLSSLTFCAESEVEGGIGDLYVGIAESEKFFSNLLCKLRLIDWLRHMWHSTVSNKGDCAEMFCATR